VLCACSLIPLGSLGGVGTLLFFHLFIGYLGVQVV